MSIQRLCLLVICLGLAGCGGRPDATRYVPAEAVAREALEAGLRAWQDGQPPGRVAGSSPAIEVVDTLRRPGQRLASFEILGEVPGNGPRCFAVRLALANPGEIVTERFCVLGIDPLWIFRQEEYEMFLHWECFDDKAKTTAAAP
jgi:hypothetical protein